jgi:hypothetical protein
MNALIRYAIYAGEPPFINTIARTDLYEGQQTSTTNWAIWPCKVEDSKGDQ